MSRTLSIHTAYQNLLSKGRLTTNPGQAALVDRLARLQQTLASGSNNVNVPLNNGLYIYGDVGTGKSRIADLFAATLPSTISRRRVHFHEFMIDTHMRLHRARSKADYSGDPLVKIGKEIYRESSVLCFDEFQVTDIADAMILKRLFGAIWESGGVVAPTSNRHPTKLYENGLNRSLFVPFIEELQRRCEVWKMEGNQDYRMSSVQPEDKKNICFFTDPSDFDTSLVAATSGRPLEEVAIPVMMNRVLLVQATTSNRPLRNDKQNGTSVTLQGKAIVHTTFPLLCEANLGTADYHALCKYASTVYLSGLRQFAADELDFVRRFVTLIDIAYESKTRVICLSTVPLFEVFEKVIASSPSTTNVNKSSAGGKSTLPILEAHGELRRQLLLDKGLTVKRGGGSSSSMMSTFIGEVEWSATGLRGTSLASGGAGETDARFAVGRAVSRLFEMNSTGYGVGDDDDGDN